MAYSDTPQQAVIALIAKKMAATSAIQGNFSSEGLAAMAQGTDARVALAQSLANKDYSTKNELQDMFDVVATRANPEDERYKDVKRMRLLTDIIKTVDVTDAVFETFAESSDTASQEPAEDEFNIFDFFEAVLSQPQVVVVERSQEPLEKEPDVVLKKRRTKNKCSSGQLSFF